MNYDQKRERRLDSFIRHYREHDQAQYQQFAKHLLVKIKDVLKNRQIDIAYSSARAKTPESLHKKCQKQIADGCGGKTYKYSYFQNEIMDMAGVRIVTYLLADVPVVQAVIEELFQVHEEDSQDKLELLGTDKVGYLSVHYIVELKPEAITPDESGYRGMKCEIQVRTVLEDAWAQVFHDRAYKNELPMMDLDTLQRKTNLLAGNLELLDAQINEVVTDYDKYSGLIQTKRLQRILNMPISRKSLLDYFKCRLGKEFCFYHYNQVKKLLDGFSVHSIRDLDFALLHTHCADKLRAHEGYLTSDRIVFYVLMITDFKKFVDIMGPNVRMSRESLEFLEEFLPIENLCNTHGIKVDG